MISLKLAHMCALLNDNAFKTTVNGSCMQFLLMKQKLEAIPETNRPNPQLHQKLASLHTEYTHEMSAL